MKCYQTLVMVGALFALVACSDTKEVTVDVKPVKLANPAAVYCAEHGIYDMATGRCQLKDNTTVDAWQFYRDQHVDKKVGMPNPAAVYCTKKYGQYSIETGECALIDGSVVDAWDYFYEQNSQ